MGAGGTAPETGASRDARAGAGARSEGALVRRGGADGGGARGDRGAGGEDGSHGASEGAGVM